MVLKQKIILGFAGIVSFIVFSYFVIAGINILNAQTYTIADVAEHASSGSCWIIINNKVYDLSDYLRLSDHPPGSSYITPYCGQDATAVYNGSARSTRGTSHRHSSRTTNTILAPFYIGDIGTPTPTIISTLTPVITIMPGTTPTPASTATPIFSPPPSQSPVPLPSYIGLSDKPITKIINDTIVWILSIAAALAILFIVVGGIYYVTASGDERRMDTAKNIITYAIFGIFLVAIAYAIVITINKVID